MLMAILRSLKVWVTGWLRGGPHFVVGNPADPYLLRYYLLPRNPLFNIYLHRFKRDDEDRALHDGFDCIIQGISGKMKEPKKELVPLGLNTT